MFIAEFPADAANHHTTAATLRAIANQVAAGTVSGVQRDDSGTIAGRWGFGPGDPGEVERLREEVSELRYWTNAALEYLAFADDEEAIQAEKVLRGTN